MKKYDLVTVRGVVASSDDWGALFEEGKRLKDYSQVIDRTKGTIWHIRDNHGYVTIDEGEIRK